MLVRGGITSSARALEAAPGLGVLSGSACVHYRAEPDRRTRFLAAVREGDLPAGLGLEDQTAALFEDGAMCETFSARDGASVWRVTPELERRLAPRRLHDPAPALDSLPPEVLELRRTLAVRAAGGRSRRPHVGRLD